MRPDAEEGPQSVIHVPTGYKTFVGQTSSLSSVTLSPDSCEQETTRRSPPSRQSTFPHADSDVTLSPPTPEPSQLNETERDRVRHESHKYKLLYGTDLSQRHSGASYTLPINTSVPPVKDRPTPRATTRQEVEEGTSRLARPSSRLEGLSNCSLSRKL